MQRLKRICSRVRVRYRITVCYLTNATFATLFTASLTDNVMKTWRAMFLYFISRRGVTAQTGMPEIATSNRNPDIMFQYFAHMFAVSVRVRAGLSIPQKFVKIRPCTTEA